MWYVLPKQSRGLTPPWRGRGYSDVLNDGGGGVNKGSEFYKFRPLGKKKCYCYAKKSGGGKHFSGTIGGVPDSNFCPGKFMGGNFERGNGGFTGMGGVFSWSRTDQSSVHPPPKPQSELGAPPL